MRSFVIIITWARLRRATGELDAVNRARFLYICRARAILKINLYLTSLYFLESKVLLRCVKMCYLNRIEQSTVETSLCYLTFFNLKTKPFLSRMFKLKVYSNSNSTS